MSQLIASLFVGFLLGLLMIIVTIAVRYLNRPAEWELQREIAVVEEREETDAR